MSTIRFYRPDIVLKSSKDKQFEMIAINPPHDLFKGTEESLLKLQFIVI